MLAFFVLSLIGSVSPSPAPSPSSAPLKTIVTVKSSPFCGAFAAHVNAAIDHAVSNDKNIGIAVTDLRSTDLDGNTIQRHQEISRLANVSDAIEAQYRAGQAEIKQLRALESTTKDTDEKTQLKAAADALSGALYRQYKLDRDLSGFVAFLYASDMNSGIDTTPGGWSTPSPFEDEQPALERSYGERTWLPGAIGPRSSILAGQESHKDDVEMAAEAARDFQGRLPAIYQDEMTAAPHIENAGQHC